MNRLIELAVKQPITVSVAVILAVLAGVLAATRVPVQMTPSVDSTVIAVTTSMTHASPRGGFACCIHNIHRGLGACIINECGPPGSLLTCTWYQIANGLPTDSRLRRHTASIRLPTGQTAATRLFTSQHTTTVPERVNVNTSSRVNECCGKILKEDCTEGCEWGPETLTVGTAKSKRSGHNRGTTSGRSESGPHATTGDILTLKQHATRVGEVSLDMIGSSLVTRTPRRAVACETREQSGARRRTSDDTRNKMQHMCMFAGWRGWDAEGRGGRRVHRTRY